MAEGLEVFKEGPKKEVVVVEITPKTVEDELKELKAEVVVLEKIISNFKKFYNNWATFKHALDDREK
jgi:UPF0288 family protein (methanogenesis marker protein 3)|tara:strand:- start:328 stop:528 length:201 start_codon:yes stop_codon:yes gene_type:complete